MTTAAPAGGQHHAAVPRLGRHAVSLPAGIAHDARRTVTGRASPGRRRRGAAGRPRPMPRTRRSSSGPSSSGSGERRVERPSRARAGGCRREPLVDHPSASRRAPRSRPSPRTRWRSRAARIGLVTVSPGSGDSIRICGDCSSIAVRPMGGSTTTPSPPIVSTGSPSRRNATRSIVGEPRERRDDLRDAAEHRRAPAAVVERAGEIHRRDTVGDGDVEERRPLGDRRHEAVGLLGAGRAGHQRLERGPGDSRRRRDRPANRGDHAVPEQVHREGRRLGRRLRRRLRRACRLGRRHGLVVPVAPGGDEHQERQQRRKHDPTALHASIVPGICSEIRMPPRARARRACGRRPGRT